MPGRASHRLKLTLATSLVSGVLLGITFGLVYLANHAVERVRIQETVDPLAAEAIGDISEGTNPDLEDLAATNARISVAMYDASGNVIRRAGSRMPPLVHGRALRTVAGDTLILSGKSAKGVTVVAAYDWTEEDADLRRLGLILGCLWVPIVGLIAGTTWVAVGRAFRPLQAMASQANEATGADLAKRLTTDDQAEFGQFAVQLNSMLDRLEGAVRREEKFAADAAHELRTPLTVLRARIEKTLLAERDGASYREALQQMLDETDRLHRLMEMLLLTAGSESALVEPTDVDLAVQRAHARWVDAFSDRGVSLDVVGAGTGAEISTEELDCVLDNLLSNALRHSAADSECQIETAAPDGHIRLTVTNEGSEIPPEDGQRIFDRFVRLDESRARSTGGVGLGLSICRRIVERRSGRIWHERRGERTAMVVELRATGDR